MLILTDKKQKALYISAYAWLTTIEEVITIVKRDTIEQRHTLK